MSDYETIRGALQGWLSLHSRRHDPQDIFPMSDRTHDALADLAQLEAEKERYRAALEEIQRCYRPLSLARHLARTALQGGKG